MSGSRLKLDGCSGSVVLVVIFWTISRMASMYGSTCSGVASTVRGLAREQASPSGALPL